MSLLLAALLCTLPVDGGVDARDGGEASGELRPAPQLPLWVDAGHAVAEEEGPDDAVAEASEAEGVAGDGGEPTDGGWPYTADLSDDELLRRWREAPATLGSVSFGVAEAGRVFNAVHLDPGEAWTLVSPREAWGTQETIEALRTVARAVREACPGASPLRVNDLGQRAGGHLRPHQTHQSGRDVDLGFYYPRGVSPGAVKKKREEAMDLAANWALVRALVTLTDVQVVLLDRRVQEALYRHALQAGEDPAWLDRLFHAGADSLFQHARRHRDHFHVRFFAPRSQELGHRLQPLLAAHPEQNVLEHRVAKGDSLGRLASRAGSTVTLIRQANHLSGAALVPGRTLTIPLRGPCPGCPQPPPVVVPPRRAPPTPPRGDG